MWHLLWIVPIVFIAGFGFGCWWVARPDDVCRMCKASYMVRIRSLEDSIHGLKSIQGKLGKELNAMAFRNAGYKAR